jgi:hypothetical protein
MRGPKSESDALTLIVGSAGGFLVAARKDKLIIRRGRKVDCSRVIVGLADFLRRNEGGLHLRHAITQDGDDVIYLLDADGRGWAERLAAPASSGWRCGE